MGFALKFSFMGRIKFRIIPNAKKCEIDGPYADAVKVRLSCPPVDGKANAQLVKFLSEFLDISKNSIKIISGETSRDKTLEIEGFEAKDILDKQNFGAL